jgi:putative DNA primase/helicase
VHSPILLVSSPEAECGKSTLLGLVSFLVPKGLTVVQISPAVLYRMIEKWRPALIVDEADNAFKDNPDLRAVMNAGWTRGTGVPRCNPDTHEPELFDTFGPKAIGLKGLKVPDTTLSRSIIVDMERKLPGEKAEGFDHIDDEELACLRQKLARFAADNLDRLRGCAPEMPEGFINRIANNWKVMLAIAELGGVGKRAREAASVLSRRADEASLGVEVLRDIKWLSENTVAERMFSEELMNKLVGPGLTCPTAARRLRRRS